MVLVLSYSNILLIVIQSKGAWIFGKILFCSQVLGKIVWLCGFYGSESKDSHCQPDFLSLTLGYMMEGEKDLLQVVLRPGMTTIVQKWCPLQKQKLNKHYFIKMCKNDYSTLIQVLYECLLHISSFLYHGLFYDKKDFCTILKSVILVRWEVTEIM